MDIVLISKILSLQTIPIYLLGFLMFVGRILDHWVNPKKAFMPIVFYVQDFIYTIVSIIVALGFCLSAETTTGTTYVVVIISGLLGSTLVRQISSKKEKIADGIIDKIEDKIDIQYNEKNELVEQKTEQKTEEQSS